MTTNRFWIVGQGEGGLVGWGGGQGLAEKYTSILQSTTHTYTHTHTHTHTQTELN